MLIRRAHVVVLYGVNLLAALDMSVPYAFRAGNVCRDGVGDPQMDADISVAEADAPLLAVLMALMAAGWIGAFLARFRRGLVSAAFVIIVVAMLSTLALLSYRRLMRVNFCACGADMVVLELLRDIVALFTMYATIYVTGAAARIRPLCVHVNVPQSLVSYCARQVTREPYHPPTNHTRADSEHDIRSIPNPYFRLSSNVLTAQ